LKIAIVTRALNGGGAERQIQVLTRALINHGITVDVVLISSSPNLRGELPPGLVHHVRAKNFIMTQVRLARTLRQLRADVVYPFLEATCLRTEILKPFLRPSKVVWAVRNSGMHRKQYSRKTQIIDWLAEKLARRADFLIANSEAGASRLRVLGCKSDHIAVVANGIDTETFRPPIDEAERFYLHNKLGLSRSTQIVGMVARCDPMKGLSEFFRIRARVLEERPAVAFVLVGYANETEFDYLRALSEKYGTSGGIHLVPRTKSPELILRSLTVYLSTSLFGEGFPNVLAEALACGVPTVATKVGDSDTVVGTHGYVNNAGDVHGAARSIIRYLDDGELPADLRHRRIKDEFGIQKLVSNTLRALELALERVEEDDL